MSLQPPHRRTAKAVLLFVALALVLVAFGVSRLRLDVDVFNLLPRDSPMVEGLRLYQRSFGSSSEVILSLRSEKTGLTESAAASLAEELEASELTPRVIWQSPFLGEPSELGELVAYLWLNRSPESFAEMRERFRGAVLEATVQRTLERLATTLRPREVARLAQDPFALTDVTDEVTAALAAGGEDPFASRDGTFRVLFVRAPFEEASFWHARDWVERISTFLEEWRRVEGLGEELTVKMTGDPVFVSEVGSGLLRDMQGAALGTLLLVAGLFWLSHRRWLPLLWLLCLLLLVLGATAAIGGLFLGSLNAVSLGFAAILLGLAADYALILYQEWADAGGTETSVAELRRGVAPSILWAAVTTAGAFAMIGRSSLPGLTELGLLVSLGILLAAVVMLGAFLPPLASGGRREDRAARPSRMERLVRAFETRSAPVWMVTGFLLVASVLVLAVRRPDIDYGTEDLGPKRSSAQRALDEIQEEIGGGGDALWLLVEGREAGDVRARLEEASAELDRAVRNGLLESYTLPEELWPHPAAQQENREQVRRLVTRLPEAKREALAAGFTEDALRLTEEVFAAWTRFAAHDRVSWPSAPGVRWVFRQFAARESERWLALGQLDAAASTSREELVRLADRITSRGSGQVFGWSLLSESLLGLMQRDVRRVLLPMGVALLVLLGLAFRRSAEILLSLASLGLGLLCLLGVMALFGWSWNLMNVMALPLLFGAGVDYSIHVQLALRRHRGDLVRVHQTVGRAILLCGASTATGFGTLALASNAGLASLGRVCATGIVLAGVVSVFLLPVWWRALRGHGESGSTTS